MEWPVSTVVSSAPRWEAHALDVVGVVLEPEGAGDVTAVAAAAQVHRGQPPAVGEGLADGRPGHQRRGDAVHGDDQSGSPAPNVARRSSPPGTGTFSTYIPPSCPTKAHVYPRRVSARVTVVEHEAEAPLGYFGGWLGDVVVCRPYLGEAVPDDPGDGLLVLGGAASAWEDDDYPWLPATRALLRAAVEREVPTLGICLGAQLMTLACGGEVVRGVNGLEVGLGEVAPVGERRSAAGPFDRTGPGDPIPPGRHDGSSRRGGPGRHRYAVSTPGVPDRASRVGVQFHPEATPAIFEQWTDGTDNTPRGRVEQAGQRRRSWSGGFMEAAGGSIRGHRRGKRA